MRRNFNSVQMLETSEDCDKYSKSVSYETLVGGTTTTGRGRKQTQKMFLSSAVKPLSAVGTLTSLLCNSAKVMEKLLRHVITRRTLVRRGYLPEKCTHANEESLFASVTWLMRLPRRIQRMLLRMMIPALAFLLSLNLSTAFAGTTCNWDGTKLIISGSGTFKGCPNDPPKTATEVIIGTGFTSIGDGAFWSASNLTSITIPDSVTSIGDYTFSGTGLKSITIPDSVTSIGEGAFWGASSLTSITIPDSVTSIGNNAFAYTSSLTNIMCKGDEISCADTVNALRASGYYRNISYPTDKTSCEGTGVSLFVWDGSKCSRRNEEQCNSVAKYYYSDGKCQVLPKTQSACTGTNIEWNATDNKCVNKNYTPTGGDDIGDVSGDFNPADCYNKGQVPYNNQCLDEYPFAKKRWTPAEANEWLHD